ncbi:LysR family transcriptional regulator [Aeromonas veronii]|uniref:LysR family transcriptional regulator n=1 Tax=Aeromonas veronii TaxID=654 RepID=UPI002444EE21|nr:LysR family transcriptional regulator [Aeromonas veronii]
MVINLHLLRIFYTVSSEGGFSNAATHLCISQPAVSKAVSELERQIGLPLLERGSGRSRKGIHLTEHGQVLFREFNFEVRHSPMPPDGTLRIP